MATKDESEWTTVAAPPRVSGDRRKKEPLVITRSCPGGAPVASGSAPVLPLGAPHPLAHRWVMWYHDLKMDTWDLPSYRQIFSFNTVEDFWIMYNNLTNLNGGMYYLMLEGYPPMWDHEKNLGGGGWTFRIDKKNSVDFWNKISCYCVGESLSDKPDNIVGISLSPKIRFVTVRVWTRSDQKNTAEFAKIARETANETVPINFAEARFTRNVEAAK